jgi:hypothetical protein
MLFVKEHADHHDKTDNQDHEENGFGWTDFPSS